MEQDKLCYFYSSMGFCRILADMQCDGQERCTFFKTEKQFNDDNDRAVELCRMRVMA